MMKVKAAPNVLLGFAELINGIFWLSAGIGHYAWNWEFSGPRLKDFHPKKIYVWFHSVQLCKKPVQSHLTPSVVLNYLTYPGYGCLLEGWWLNGGHSFSGTLFIFTVSYPVHLMPKETIAQSKTGKTKKRINRKPFFTDLYSQGIWW